MLRIISKILSQPPERHILTVVLQNYEKSAVKHFIEKPLLLGFLDFSTIFCPRLQIEILILNIQLQISTAF